MKHLLTMFAMALICVFNFFTFQCERPEPVIGMPREATPTAAPTKIVTEAPTPTVTETEIDFDLAHLDVVEVKEPVKYSEKELNILYRCVEAEAADQGIKGKALVARVILNRVESNEWPNTIQKVVYQKGQFAVVRDGSIDRRKVTKETIEACQMALNGWDDAEGAMYFRTVTKGRNEWHYTALDWLFDYGDHSFFK